MKEANITNQVFPIASYALVDFGFSRLKANALLVMNPVLSGIAPSVAPTLEIDKFCQSLNVGSPNIDMIFDGTRGRFALENMSWVNYIDSGYGSSPISTAGNSVITKNKASNFKNAQGQVENLPFLFFRPVPYQWLQYAQTGLGIRNVSVLTLDDEPVEIDPLDDNDIRNKYSKSLLDRLGFSYEQLTDSYGLPDAIFTQRHYQTTRKLPYTNFFPYPLTNNLEFDTAKNEGLSVNASGLPMFNPNVTRGTNINISAESDKTYAVSLPRKLVFPYWLIQSDIITGVNYSSNGKPQNILAICSRTYTNGDFALSPQSNYSFIATMPFVITGIKTTILNPDYTSANVEDGTCVIYKVVSPIPMFKPEEEEPKTQKKIKS
jgi:hypothetical protein